MSASRSSATASGSKLSPRAVRRALWWNKRLKRNPLPSPAPTSGCDSSAPVDPSARIEELASEIRSLKRLIRTRLFSTSVPAQARSLPTASSSLPSFHRADDSSGDSAVVEVVHSHGVLREAHQELSALPRAAPLASYDLVSLSSASPLSLAPITVELFRFSRCLVSSARVFSTFGLAPPVSASLALLWSVSCFLRSDYSTVPTLPGLRSALTIFGFGFSVDSSVASFSVPTPLFGKFALTVPVSMLPRSLVPASTRPSFPLVELLPVVVLSVLSPRWSVVSALLRSVPVFDLPASVSPRLLGPPIDRGFTSLISTSFFVQDFCETYQALAFYVYDMTYYRTSAPRELRYEQYVVFSLHCGLEPVSSAQFTVVVDSPRPSALSHGYISRSVPLSRIENIRRSLVHWDSFVYATGVLFDHLDVLDAVFPPRVVSGDWPAPLAPVLYDSVLDAPYFGPY